MMSVGGAEARGDAGDRRKAEVVNVVVEKPRAGAADDDVGLFVEGDRAASDDVLIGGGDGQRHGFAESDVEDFFQRPCGEAERIVGHCKFTIPGRTLAARAAYRMA